MIPKRSCVLQPVNYSRHSRASQVQVLVKPVDKHADPDSNKDNGHERNSPSEPS